MNDTNNLEKKIYIPNYQVPKTFVDDLQVYNYKLFDRMSAIVFLFTIVFLPVTINLLYQYVFFDIVWFRYFNFIFYIAGFVFFIVTEPKKFISSGAWGIYLYFLSEIIMTFLLMFIYPFLSKDLKDNKITMKTIGIFMQSLVFIAIIVIILVFSTELRMRLINTFKYNFLLIIITSVIIFLISDPISYSFKFLHKLINGEQMPNNQKGLEEIFNNNVLGKIVVFISAILVAPLIEELTMRHSFFLLSRNRWLGFFLSTFYFAFIHVAGVNSNHEPELGNIFVYLTGSLVLSGLFVFARENVAYTYSLHLMINFIQIILLLVKYQ